MAVQLNKTAVTECHGTEAYKTVVIHLYSDA